MCNPSTAGVERDDPTISRCVAFARSWGYTSLTVYNLFALRATNPDALKVHPDPVGPDNDTWLRRAANHDLTVAAWGFVGGRFAVRVSHVADILTAAEVTLHHLGLTQTRHPRHPLYLPKTTQPIPYLASELPRARS